MLNQFNNVFISTLNEHEPLIDKKVRNNGIKWLNKDINV